METSATPESIGSIEYQANSRALDFLTVCHACPKGIYLTAPPDHPNEWEGVLFARQGPFMPAIFRFQIIFPERYPHSPPVIVFTSDVFHPLVSPLTTYTFTNQEHEGETVSASDQQRLPPGAFSLRHGFPQLFSQARSASSQDKAIFEENIPTTTVGVPQPPTQDPLPHIAVMLFYLRAAFTSEQVLDSIPLESAANSAAWHAWRAHRAKLAGRSEANRTKADTRSETPKIQPGGAKSPGEWNWNGVWEDRVRKAIRNSTSEQAVFKQPGLSEDTIQFANIDDTEMGRLVPWSSQLARSAHITSDAAS